MVGPVMSRNRWIAAVGAVVVLASVVVGITVGGDRTPQRAGNEPGAASDAPSSSEPSQPGSGTGAGGSGPTASPPVPDRNNPNGANLPAGIMLSAGQARQPAAPVEVADGDPLTAEQIKAVTDRLPDWKDPDELGSAFHWPTQTTPKPQGGTTVGTEFPGPASAASPEKPEQTPTGPLTVLRMQPQGTVAIAPFISITFNQPMVPVGTVGQLAEGDPPATIEPKTPGSWQWIGTETVRFAADRDSDVNGGVDRLPMATKFTVTVPAGTTSATGAALEKAETFTFDTPPPKVTEFGPEGKSLPLEPVFVAVFDQRVDPATVLKTLTLTAGDHPQPIRLATDDEIAADTAAAGALETAPDGRAVAFRAEQALPTDSAITVTVGQGTASAEGPRSTAKDQVFTGRTYAALTLKKTDCGWGRCDPGAPIMLTFSNPIDVEAFDPQTVRISPELPGGATVTADGNAIAVQGATQPVTEYTVTVGAGLLDTYGQQLVKSASTTVKTRAVSARLEPFGSPVTTIDPMADKPSISVNSVNRTEFRLRVFAVTPSDWTAYHSFYREYLEGKLDKSSTKVPDWTVVIDRVVRIDGADNRVVATNLDLSDALGPDSSQHAVVLIDNTGTESFNSEERWQNRSTLTWVQDTSIGLDVVNDATEMRAWATDLRTGKPLSGIAVGPYREGTIDDERSATTDADGLAELTLGGGTSAMLATDGARTAFLPSSMWQNDWRASSQKDRVLWYVNDDRQTYRPGETVSVKGWVRRQGSDARASLSGVPADSTVDYEAYDGYGNKIDRGTATVSALGGFDLTMKIPDGANLGQAYLQLNLRGISDVEEPYGSHTFTIADFRTPDFEVATHLDGTDPAVVGDDLSVAADATYYAGGPLGDAGVDWQVRTAPATYAPPGWDRFAFGLWTPWWQTAPGFTIQGDGYGRYQPYDNCCGEPDPAAADVQTFAGTTDGTGSDYLQVRVGDLGEKYAGLPVSLTTQATVTDVNRQEIAGTADLLVHPADYYVGLAAGSTFVRQGEPLVVQAIGTDIDGAATAGLTIDVRAARITSTWSNGESTDTETDPQSCRVTSTDEPVECTFDPAAAGSYRITATVTDEQGRTSRSELTRWVAGLDGSIDSSVREQQLTLVPDKQQYRPGDKAKVLVQSPIATGSGLLTLTQNGIVDTSTFTVQDGSAVVEVPITDADVPGLTASIEVVGTAPRSAGGDDAEGPERPAYATGSLSLPVSTTSRTLEVTATPRDSMVAPGGSTTLDVKVADQDGQPVSGSEFEVIVADEAVLAVGGYQLPDPLQAFYPPAYGWLSANFARSLVMLARPPALQQGSDGAASGESSSAAGAASGAAGGAEADAAAPASAESADAGDAALSTQGASRSAAKTPIAERTNFEPLALFVPSVTTDADGQAAVEVPLPDSLTRYRVMVVAVGGADTFGTAESTITAGLPLTVRSAAPAFLNFGDTLELPVLVQNHTDAAVRADVVLQAANLTTTGPAGQRVEVPADGRIEVRFAVAADRAGTARFRAAVAGGDGADAVTVELPVYTPATTETFATYGTVSGGNSVQQPVIAPEGVVAQYGGLQVSTSSTALQQLTDAVGYLADYEYETSDGLAGQIIAIGSLGDVLQAFKAPGIPSPEKLKAMVDADVAKLLALQNDGGGFPYWRRGEKSDPFNSIQATQALLVGKAYGATVPQGHLDRADTYLSEIDRHIPDTASREARDTLNAYALNVRMQAGNRDAEAAEKLVTARGTALPLDAVAWLLPVVQDPAAIEALTRTVGNAAVDNAGSVTFTNKVVDDAWTTLQSDVRTDGLILDALLAVDPDSDLIGKIVAGLMSSQRGGHWNNVQENAFILLALRHYYDTFEQTTPDFVAGVWLGEKFAGDHTYSGHTTDRATVTVPTAELIKADDDSDVTIGNDGAGTLYYRIGLQTAPQDLNLDPLDRGFVVTRSYRAVDDPGDVTRDADGWHIKAGARVRVELELVSHSAQSHVALIDPLPAGLQIMNPDLATTGKDFEPPKAPDDGGPVAADGGMTTVSWTPTWFDHQNLRDDRAEAFSSWLQGGVYSYSYQATATTPGSFVAPPTRAEQIYAPETFGRAGTDRVVIED